MVDTSRLVAGGPTEPAGAGKILPSLPNRGSASTSAGDGWYTGFNKMQSRGRQHERAEQETTESIRRRLLADISGPGALVSHSAAPSAGAGRGEGRGEDAEMERLRGMMATMVSEMVAVEVGGLRAQVRALEDQISLMRREVTALRGSQGSENDSR